MKKILLSLFILSSYCTVFAQNAPKGAKQIIVSVDTTRSQKLVLKEFVAYLTQRGYEIENYNKDLSLITTKGKEVKFWNIRLSIFFEEGKLKFTGKAFSEMLGTTDTWTVENKGSLGNVYVHTWREMYETALNFPHYSVEYKM